MATQQTSHRPPSNPDDALMQIWRQLNSIRTMLSFFVVIAVVGIAAGVIIGILSLTTSSSSM